jgi:hypothetical protein
MALQKSITTEYGFVCSESYHQIGDLIYSKGLPVKGVVRIFKDLQARTDGYPHFKVFEFSFDWPLDEGNNIVSYAYTYLKTLPEYQNATDV